MTRSSSAYLRNMRIGVLIVNVLLHVVASQPICDTGGECDCQTVVALSANQEFTLRCRLPPEDSRSGPDWQAVVSLNSFLRPVSAYIATGSDCPDSGITTSQFSTSNFEQQFLSFSEGSVSRTLSINWLPGQTRCLVIACRSTNCDVELSFEYVYNPPTASSPTLASTFTRSPTAFYTASPTTTSPTASPTTTSPTASPTTSPGSSSNMGILIGGIAGGVVLILLIGSFLGCYFKKLHATGKAKADGETHTTVVGKPVDVDSIHAEL